MPQWPSNLPSFNGEGWVEGMPDVVERVQMSAGRDYVRGKSTVGPYPVRGEIPMTYAQYLALESFFMGDLGGGALEFTMTHPLRNQTITCQFTAPPSLEYEAFGLYMVAVEFEVLP